MSDTQTSQKAVAGKPEEKPTVKMEPPPSWAIELSKRVAEGFASVEARLDTVETNVTILVDDKRSVNDRLSRIETWKENEVNTRLSANSERVRGESSVNLKQDQVIAEVLTKVNALADKPDTTELVIGEIKSAAKTPLGQKVIGAVVGVTLLGLGVASLSLQAKMAQLEAKPAPPTVVVVSAMPDGGTR